MQNLFLINWCLKKFLGGPVTKVFARRRVITFHTPLITLSALWSFPASAIEIEILKQKGCKLLLSRSSELSTDQVIKGSLASGLPIELKVTSVTAGKAVAKMRARAGKCDSVAGELVLVGANKNQNINRFGIGLLGAGGQFTFKQPFSPKGSNASTNNSSSQELFVNGLSGIGYSGGLVGRVLLKNPLNIEISAQVLAANTTGKTDLPNGDTFTVTGKFLEYTVQPSIAFTSCISSRLYCKVGGVFGFPMKSSITVADSSFNATAPLKYQRLGADLAAGVNLGKKFSIVGGGQISQVKGSFKFESESDAVNLAVLAVYVFGGFVAVF